MIPSLWFILLLSCFSSRIVVAFSSANDSHLVADNWSCHPFGLCEACPEDSLHEPFCQPFGNRRLVHCLQSEEENDRVQHGGVHPVIGEIPAWEACGRIVSQEMADFWEFVLCNALIASLSLFVLYNRSRAVASRRRKALAARIGVQRPW
ncbi:hypothetical protein PIIN_03474 [Serendipita indica DSM 11827]|uniref:Uncharacterized protein n=1 Tax=Serendipita indica (strain DSM 11827) TaxID=1109443 RepID=G4TDZ8_SERID|nr:hypothetical protein PIIN_03474 [Serendipita indica DSM 11827]